MSEECIQGNGRNYFGTINVTANEEICQRWDLVYSDMDAVEVNSFFSGHTTLSSIENYCRNPYSDDRPWCYTTLDGSASSFCDIPTCSHLEGKVI